MFDTFAAILDCMYNRLRGISVCGNLPKLARRIVKPDNVSWTHPEVSISCDSGDRLYFLSSKLNIFQLIGRCRDSSACHNLDEVCSCSNLLSCGFDTVFHSIADSTKISVRATAALFMIIGPLLRSAHQSLWKRSLDSRGCLHAHQFVRGHGPTKKALVQERHHLR